ncbi:C40 family peptidase [Cohnella boryungensis]|uniref:C40 family peptidase n=1 Tax=Cohnella boryungensis TaxID=768479 RepID=A0ABV8SJ38_9BACL
MKNNFVRSNIGKAVAGAALSVTIALSAGSIFAGGPTAFAAATKSTTAVSKATSASVADDIIATGKKFMGVRYLYGAESNRTDAFDCSSFLQYIFKQNGIQLPRSSRDQSKVGVAVKKSDLQPGDLVFSDTNRDGVINHVSLYIGDGKLLHTYRVGIGVTISDFEGSAWDRNYVTARRVIPQDADNGSGDAQSGENSSQDNSAGQNDLTGTDASDNEVSQPYKTPFAAPSYWKQVRNYR